MIQGLSILCIESLYDRSTIQECLDGITNHSKFSPFNIHSYYYYFAYSMMKNNSDI